MHYCAGSFARLVLRLRQALQMCLPARWQIGFAELIYQVSSIRCLSGFSITDNNYITTPNCSKNLCNTFIYWYCIGFVFNFVLTIIFNIK